MDNEQVELLENIAALEVFGNLPIRPQRYEWEPRPGPTDSYVLPLQVERDLVQTLGFLSSVDDDPNTITAVCFQELGDRSRVLVSVNRLIPGWTKYLQKVNAGFQDLFGIMSRGRCMSRDQLEDDLFRLVISMCRQRILTRTRLEQSWAEKKGMKSPKPKLGYLIKKCVEGIRHTSLKTEFTAASTSLMQALEQCQEAHCPAQGQEVSAEQLMSLIQAFKAFSTSPVVENALVKDRKSALPKTDPSMTKGLWTTARKIGLYKSYAGQLTKMAKRYPILRKISVVSIYMDFNAIPHPIDDSTITSRDLDAVLSRAAMSQGRDLPLKEIYDKLPRDAWDKLLKFPERVTTSRNSAKVHAEMQLVWYLDAFADTSPPRYICSSKDACYLCSEFISWHGRYVIPATHGKIYPGWKLPMGMPTETRRAFNRELENRIIHRADAVLRGQTERFENPCESNAPSTMEPWSAESTVRSSLSDQEVSSSDETITPATVARTSTSSIVETSRESQDCDAMRGASHRLSVSVPSGQTVLAYASPRVRLYVEYQVGSAQLSRHLGMNIQSADLGELRSCCEEVAEHDMDLAREGSRSVSPCRGCSSLRLNVNGEGLGIELEKFVNAFTET